MVNLRHMSRILYRHDWRTVEEWAVAIEHLADLTEQEIGELVAGAPPSWNGDRPLLLAPPRVADTYR